MKKHIFLFAAVFLCMLNPYFMHQVNGQLAEVSSSTFINGFPIKINESDVNWGDYDNDGDLDILAVGYPSFNGNASYHVQIYNNNSITGQFVPIFPNLEPIQLPTASWADYDNDGDLDILLLGMNNSYQPFGQLYRNDGGNFVPIATNIPGCWGSSVDWGDYDNDGDLDLLMSGFRFNTRITKLFRNDGNGQFIEISVPFPGVEFGELKWWDYDKDGDLDVILTGDDAVGAFHSEVYTNNINTNGGFTLNALLSAGLPNLTGGNLAIADYDGDGNMDVLLAGQLASGPYITRIYRMSNGFFTEYNPGFIGIKDGDVSWADYDNDGLPDIAINGLTNSSRTSKLYRNTGNNFFTEVFTGLTSTEKGNVRWGDFNNDNKIDLLLTGRTTSTEESSTNRFMGLYLNNNLSINTAPTPPSTLSNSVSGNTVTLNWGAGNDFQTSQNGLTYNIRVGTSSGAGDIVSPMAHADGYRKIVDHGNVYQNRSWSIKDLPNGTYYWSVQSIDGNYLGSAFSAEQTFTIGQQQTTDLSFSQFNIGNSCLSPGDQVNITAFISNSGATLTPFFNFSIYLSNNPQYDNSDLLLSSSFTAVQGNSSTDVSRIVTIPSNISPGSYYLIGSIDHTQAIVEANESNNQQALGFSILPAVEAGTSLTLCPNSGSITLTGMSPSGGTWSGSGIINSNGQFSPSVAGPGLHLLTYTYSINGCSASDTRLITVEDLLDPNIICPANTTVACNGSTSPSVTGFAIATDNCDSNPQISFLDEFTVDNVTQESIIRRTWTATDAVGNTANCVQIITVSDQVDPSITCPTSITVNTASNTCDALIATSSLTPIYSDDCNTVSLSYIVTGATPLTGNGGITSRRFNQGISTITYTAADLAGNTASCSFNVQVLDNTAPTIICPTNITQSVPIGSCSSPVNYSLPNYTDNCPSSTLSLIQGLTPGNDFPIGSTTVTYRVTDASGNNNQCSFIVNIVPNGQVDAGPDVTTCINEAPFNMQANTPGGIWSGSGIINASTGRVDPFQAGVGTHVLTYTVGQSGCATSSSTALLIVNDTTPIQPILDLTICINNGNYFFGSMNPSGGTWTGPGVTNGGISFNPSLVGVGLHQITYEYTNPSGCESTFSRGIRVNPTPDIQIAGDTVYPLINVPQTLPAATPAGGRWFGSGVIDPNGSFLPTQVGAGTFAVFYTYTDPTTLCIDTANIQVTVDPTLIQTDLIQLRSGWNLISTDVIPEDSSIVSVFSSLLPNNLVYVTGFHGGAIVYDPSLPPFLNTLTHIRSNYGYWVRVNQAATLSITGTPIDPSVKRNLFAGTNNLIAYIPQESISPEAYFPSLIANGDLIAVSGFDGGSQFYDPLVPTFLNSLDSLRNGFGYYVQVSNSVDGDNYRKGAPTYVSPDFMFIGGEILGNIVEGSQLGIETSDGRTVGKISVHQNGLLIPTPVYGDNPYTPEVDGLQTGDTLWLTHKGHRLSPAISFIADKAVHKQSFQGASSELNIYPNPSTDKLHFDYQILQDARVEVSIYNIHGAEIQKILSDNQSAGSHHFIWEFENLPKGSYLVRFQSGANKPVWKKVLIAP